MVPNGSVAVDTWRRCCWWTEATPGRRPAMHVLITEARFDDAQEVAERLHDAGCHVTRCHDRVGICRALAPAGHCPLDNREPVDLVVDVRAASPELTAREYGAVCAVRARIPLAIVSATDELPVVPPGLERRAAAVTRTELLDACRTAMRDEIGVG